ncbi:MAG TPA: hypothetical protein VIY48_17495 [Candidatus Paceibacterota bacterium]
MTDDLRQLGQEAVIARAIKDIVDGTVTSARERLKEEFDKSGVERQKIYDKDGDLAGTIVYPEPSVTVEINDKEAMLEWLDRKRPEHLRKRVIYEIDPTYWRLLQEASKKAGVGIDPDDGEALHWITVSVATRYIKVTPTQDMKNKVQAYLLSTMKAIEEG